MREFLFALGGVCLGGGGANIYYANTGTGYLIVGIILTFVACNLGADDVETVSTEKPD